MTPSGPTDVKLKPTGPEHRLRYGILALAGFGIVGRVSDEEARGNDLSYRRERRVVGTEVNAVGLGSECDVRAVVYEQQGPELSGERP